MRGKISLLLILFFCCVIKLQAQNVPEIGKVIQEELMMKECPFDPEADAVIFVDEAFADYDDQYRLVTWRHIRMKILKEKGVSEGDISIPYYKRDDFEYITDIEGVVINPNPGAPPSMTYLDKKTIFDKKVNDYFGEKRFGFPSLKPGSIIEYRYKSTMKHYRGLDKWYFQQEQPVMYSRYSLTIIPNYEFTYQVQKSDQFKILINQEKNTGRITFEMRNIPGLRDEPYMDAPKDYLQMVKFQLSASGSGFNKREYSSTWQQLAREFMSSKYIGGQLNVKLSGSEEFISEVKKYASELEKMTAVFEYVRKNMTWTGIDVRFSPDGIKNAWSKKNGTSGDLNLILLNLLQAADLDANPAMVSERHHGMVRKEYPFEDQFNTIYAAVTIGKNRYFLDATNKHSPAHITPYNILNTTVFIIGKKSWELVTVNDNKLIYADHSTTSLKLGTDGNITGECFLKSSDYAKVVRLRSLRNDQENYISSWFKTTYKNISLEGFKVSNENVDTLPLENTFTFSLPAQSTGEYTFLPTNFFTGMNENVFLATNRFTNINFGYRQKFTSAVYIDLPEGYVIDALPKSVQLMNHDKSMNFTRQVITDEKNRFKILLRYQVEFTRSLYTADDYPDLKVFYKKMFDYLGEHIVLKKK